MPKFIKTNIIVEVNRHGVESDRQVLFTEDEVISRVLLNPSLIIEVTESHAVQVVRPQGKYQEISEDTLIEIDRQRASGRAKIEGMKLDSLIEGDIVYKGVGEDVIITADEGENDEPLTFGSSE
jgi:hypothetical protein